MTNRRSSSRYPVSWPVHFDKGDGVTLNLSTTGVLFQTQNPPEAHQTLALTIHNSQQTQSWLANLYCTGKVVRVYLEAGQHHVAVCFNDFRFLNDRMPATEAYI